MMSELVNDCTISRTIIHHNTFYIRCLQHHKAQRGVIDSFSDMSEFKIVLEDMDKPLQQDVKSTMDSLIRSYYLLDANDNGKYEDETKEPRLIIMRYIGFNGEATLWTQFGAIFELERRNANGNFKYKFKGMKRER